MKVVMLGADRSVKGGVSAVVNNLYEAGLNQRIDLTYMGRWWTEALLRSC